MAADSLDELEALHRDLEALKENRMPNIDRLAAELEAHVDEFRSLLEQKKRNGESRRKLCSGRFNTIFQRPAHLTAPASAFSFSG
jgi:nuclear pore complex protein Nup205